MRPIVSDRGPQCTSQVWQPFYQGLGATNSLISGYNPQTNGQTEWTNQDLETSLSCITASNPSAWNSFLPWIKYAHNSLVSSASGMSPFEASLPSVQHNLRHYVNIWNKTRAIHLQTFANTKQAAEKHSAPAPQYHTGQSVWLSLSAMATAVPKDIVFIGYAVHSHEHDITRIH